MPDWARPRHGQHLELPLPLQPPPQGPVIAVGRVADPPSGPLRSPGPILRAQHPRGSSRDRRTLLHHVPLSY